jgi:hypothetical protein
MGTNIYIQSDFQEEYDKYLHDPMGKIRWKRLSRGGRNRREIFELLKNYIGAVGKYRDNVVPNGTVQELHDKYSDYTMGKFNHTWDNTGIKHSFSELVIYEDEMAHRGEGKKIEYASDAIITCPNSYASVLLITEQEFSMSYRELYIGNVQYNFTYVSLSDHWRSNCGYVIVLYDGKITHGDNPRIPFTNKVGTVIDSPMFAFDYIKSPVCTSQNPDGSPQRFYVDFNDAPGLPEEVLIHAYGDERQGDYVPFSEIISPEEVSKLIERAMNSG